MTLSQQLREAGEKATPGDWSFTRNGWDMTTIYDAHGHLICEVPISWAADEDTQEQFEEIKDATAALIVLLRNNLGTIIAALEALEAQEAGK